MLRIASRLAALLAVGALLAGTANGASARSPRASASALRSLDGALNVGMKAVGRFSGAYVVDLTNGHVLYSKNARIARLPASVEKLYTTSAALSEFGPDATLTTSVLGLGQARAGTYTGTLYLRGGGDPTFGSATFDEANYGTGATVQQLVANLIAATQIKKLNGPVVADQSMFDSLRGTPATGNAPSTEVEGELGALTFNRGWANSDGTALVAHPALQAGQQ
ncbi:MAG TPA: D-alanyl-D-alanine carboxypeptidase, partial [Solirubrobacteraceae bacterium]|nr:D-alanyl-D-alanine carboxypeptidase [Solirubrobacteraceae bacterium]